MKRVLITGGTRGIGFAMAERFHSSGYDVIIIGRSEDSEVKENLEKLRDKGWNGEVIFTDLSEYNNCLSVHKNVGDVDILINNAGVYNRKKFTELTPENWELTMRVNLHSVFYMTSLFTPGMIENGWGRIINISSVLAFTGSSSGADYAAAKAGIIGFTRSIARELGSHGITVNAIAPGPVDTRIIAGDTPEKRKWRIENTPTRRISTPEDIAGVALFLASDDAAQITGQVIHVNGGYFIG